MRLPPLRSSLRNQRGQIIIFTMLAVVFLLVIAGSLASDVAKLIAAKSEAQSSLDAAALAGAGKLGFDSTVFGTARDFAVNFAGLNQTKTVPRIVTLDRNDANDPSVFDAATITPAGTGDVLLGIWDPTKPDGIGIGKRFEPSLDGTIVNSVMCRYKKQVAGNFMSLWGFFPMNVAASAVATANPPETAPTDACLFPIGVGSCPFQGNTSLGCGATITFITSSNQGDGAGCLAPPCSNSAAWVGLDPNLAPNPSNLVDQINAAANGQCGGSPLKTGDNIATNNGMQTPTMNAVRDAFIQKYNASGTVEVLDSNGNATYSGKGWKVYIPIIETACPAGAISGDHKVIGWTEFVMTQVITSGNCAVENHYSGNPWDAIGKTPNCSGTNVPQNSGALRAIFGYYSCNIIPVNPNPLPGPRSALATRLRLVR
jgi:hypothetical protein